MSLTPLKPSLFTTPDGVERLLRFSFGTQKRIADRFGGGTLWDVLQKDGAFVLPELLWLFLFDAKNKPPNDLTLEDLQESLAPQDRNYILASLLESASQCSIEKKLLLAALEQSDQRALKKILGLISGASDTSTSESGTPINSGDSPQESSTPSPSDTANPSVAPIVESELSQPQLST